MSEGRHSIAWLTATGEDWPKLQMLIEKAISRFAEDGFVICDGSWRTDINAVGVPLVSADGTEVYAFNCGGPPHQFDRHSMRSKFGPALREMVGNIDLELNGRPSG